MKRNDRFHFSSMKFSDEDFEELFIALPNDLLKEPFVRSTSLFKKYFPGFRVQNLPTERIKAAIKSEMNSRNNNLADFLLSEFVNVILSKDEIEVSNLLKKIIVDNKEILSSLIRQAENIQSEIRLSAENSIKDSHDEGHKIETKIAKNELALNELNHKLDSDIKEYQKEVATYEYMIAESEDRKKNQQRIIEDAKNEIQKLGFQQNDLSEKAEQAKVNLEKAKAKINHRVSALQDEISSFKNRLSENDIKIETSTKSAEEEIKKYDTKIESLMRLEIKISQRRSEKDLVIGNDALPVYRNIVDEAKINLSGYSKWQPYSTLLQKLSSPLSHDEKYAFRKPSEYLNAARKSEDLSDLAFEAFTGWKVSEKNNDKTAALEYYSRFLLLKGIDEIGKNYINARLFLAESIKTQHKLIGIVEESQKLRDFSTAILLYSYLIEHSHAKIADKASLFDPTFAQFSFNSTLESLISHNMFSQVTLLIEDLCSVDLDYPLQIFADHIVNDKALFEKSFNLLISRISSRNKNLIKFLIHVIMRHYKDAINLKNLQEKQRDTSILI